MYVGVQDTGKPFQAALMMDIPGFVAQMRHQAGCAHLTQAVHTCCGVLSNRLLEWGPALICGFEFCFAVNANCWIDASNHTCHCEISTLIANIMQAVAVQAT